MSCRCFETCEPEIHWLEQLRKDIEANEIRRRNNRLRIRLKNWIRSKYLDTFPSMNSANWIKVIPMNPPSGVDFWSINDKSYKYGYTETNLNGE